MQSWVTKNNYLRVAISNWEIWFFWPIPEPLKDNDCIQMKLCFLYVMQLHIGLKNFCWIDLEKIDLTEKFKLWLRIIFFFFFFQTIEIIIDFHLPQISSCREMADVEDLIENSQNISFDFGKSFFILHCYCVFFFYLAEWRKFFIFKTTCTFFFYTVKVLQEDLNQS